MGIVNFIKEAWTELKVVFGQATKDKFYSSQRVLPDKETAVREFQRSKEKLFYVNKWSDLPGITSDFTVFTAGGKEKASGIPQTGDFIFINLPGPTPETWVEVIDVREDENCAEFTVTPSPDPREGQQEVRDVEHFFSDEATSTFRVVLKGNTIYGCEIGKKEGINNKGEKAGGREVVNTLIALGGWMAFQEIQWHKLTDYLVHQIEIEE